MKKLLFILLLISSFARGQQWHDLRISYSDLTVYSDTSAIVNIITYDSTIAIHSSIVKIETPFAGSGLSDFTASVSWNTLSTLTDVTISSGSLGGPYEAQCVECADEGIGSQPGNVVNATTNSVLVVSLYVTATGCNLDDLTAGSILVRLFISSLP